MPKFITAAGRVGRDGGGGGASALSKEADWSMQAWHRLAFRPLNREEIDRRATELAVRTSAASGGH